MQEFLPRRPSESHSSDGGRKPPATAQNGTGTVTPP